MRSVRMLRKFLLPRDHCKQCSILFQCGFKERRKEEDKMEERKGTHCRPSPYKHITIGKVIFSDQSIASSGTCEVSLKIASVFAMQHLTLHEILPFLRWVP